MNKYIVAIVVVLTTILVILASNKEIKAESASGEVDVMWVDMPVELLDGNTIKADYLYVVGGYHSIDSGSVFPWGAVYIDDIRFIGDRMGDFVIEYTDGSKDTVPLVFGYTMWYKKVWKSSFVAPFKGKGSNSDLSKLLSDTLYLNGAFDAQDVFSFRVSVNSDLPIKRIYVEDNADKNGTPIVNGVYFVEGEAPEILNKGKFTVKEQKNFFDAHTIDSKNPFPDTIQNALFQLKRAVTSDMEDYKAAPDFTYPNVNTGASILFSGNTYAQIASGVLYYNLQDLIQRVDEKGFLHESRKDNYNYCYEGFGTYNRAYEGSYYNSYFSRNKSILTLNYYGETEKAELALNYANNALMLFKKNNLMLKGVAIPGHWGVFVNNPLEYAKGKNSTKYTKAAFGEDYKNIGNAENDGHGMMMLSNYNVWQNAGGKADWVEAHWEYINEAANWIVWSFEYPELSFMKDDVLYSESEGANWMGYSLYCNIPCYYGLLKYADMAKVAGKIEEAERWNNCAERLKQGIKAKFVTKDGIWDTSKDGYPRDPVLISMIYSRGFDVIDMDQELLKISQKTYIHDIKEVLKCGGYWGAYGTGYDHAVITQNALLLDQMEDATQLVNNLSKICYAPRQPEPYLIPEAFAVDTTNSIIRRQGDLGNLFQLSETMGCYSMIIGVSPLQIESGILKIMPRLPADWNINIENFEIQNTDSTLNMVVSYPDGENQNVKLTFSTMDEKVKKVQYRMGPFTAETNKVDVTMNGTAVHCNLYQSGDRKWAWVILEPKADTVIELNASYKVPSQGDFLKIAIPVAIAGASLVAVMVVIAKKKKK